MVGDGRGAWRDRGVRHHDRVVRGLADQVVAERGVGVEPDVRGAHQPVDGQRGGRLVAPVVAPGPAVRGVEDRVLGDVAEVAGALVLVAGHHHRGRRVGGPQPGDERGLDAVALQTPLPGLSVRVGRVVGVVEPDVLTGGDVLQEDVGHLEPRAVEVGHPDGVGLDEPPGVTPPGDGVLHAGTSPELHTGVDAEPGAGQLLEPVVLLGLELLEADHLELVLVDQAHRPRHPLAGVRPARALAGVGVVGPEDVEGGELERRARGRARRRTGERTVVVGAAGVRDPEGGEGEGRGGRQDPHSHQPAGTETVAHQGPSRGSGRWGRNGPGSRRQA